MHNAISKRDRFGIYLKIENLSLELLALAIEAAYKPRSQKLSVLETLRTKIEIAKQLIRTAHELKIFQDKVYLNLEEGLQEVSKMANGWIKYASTE